VNDIVPELQKIRRLMRWTIGLISILIVLVVIVNGLLVVVVLSENDPTSIPTGTQEVMIFTVTPQSVTFTAVPSLTPFSTSTELSTVNPTNTVNPAHQTVPTATWTLPVALTATPIPPRNIILRLSNQAAANQTVEQAHENNIELSAVEAEFVPGGLILKGTIKIPGPGGTSFSRSLELAGTIEIQDRKLQFLLTSLEVGGDDYTDSDYATTIEYIINNWFRSLLVRRDAQDFTVDDEGMIVEAVEYP
jgi:hypothetical protein